MATMSMEKENKLSIRFSRGTECYLRGFTPSYLKGSTKGSIILAREIRVKNKNKKINQGHGDLHKLTCQDV